METRLGLRRGCQNKTRAGQCLNSKNRFYFQDCCNRRQKTSSLELGSDPKMARAAGFTAKEQGQGMGTVDGKFPRGRQRGEGDSDLTGFFFFFLFFLKLIYLF